MRARRRRGGRPRWERHRRRGRRPPTRRDPRGRRGDRRPARPVGRPRPDRPLHDAGLHAPPLLDLVLRRGPAARRRAGLRARRGGRSATKNHVANRRGMNAGVVQRAIGTREAGPSSRARSPRGAREEPRGGAPRPRRADAATEDRRGLVRRPRGPGRRPRRRILRINLAAGKRVQPRPERHRGRPLDEQHLGLIAVAGRSRTTVAAGRGTATSLRPGLRRRAGRGAQRVRDREAAGEVATDVRRRPAVDRIRSASSGIADRARVGATATTRFGGPPRRDREERLRRRIGRVADDRELGDPAEREVDRLEPAWRRRSGSGRGTRVTVASARSAASR